MSNVSIDVSTYINSSTFIITLVSISVRNLQLVDYFTLFLSFHMVG